MQYKNIIMEKHVFYRGLQEFLKTYKVYMSNYLGELKKINLNE